MLKTRMARQADGYELQRLFVKTYHIDEAEHRAFFSWCFSCRQCDHTVNSLAGTSCTRQQYYFGL
jgi:hypothetical protein